LEELWQNEAGALKKNARMICLHLEDFVMLALNCARADEKALSIIEVFLNRQTRVSG